MRCLWHSNAPFVRSGYGQQTRLFAPRIRDLGHEMMISAYWGLNGTVTTWDGMTVFPGDEVWGNRLLPELAAHVAADVVITLMDVHVLDTERLRGLPLACWVPVDHDPVPPKVLRFFAETGAIPIAMSRFGQRMLKDAGLNAIYVPHGVDLSVYGPREDARRRGRERLGVADDVFLVGMVAANKGSNPPRKAFPQILQAFAAFRDRHKDAVMYLHTDPVGHRGVHLAKLTDQLLIPEGAVMCPSMMRYELGEPDDVMADMFAAFDVLVNTSYGEGFGVPIIEAQAAGTPVIVTNASAMPELVGAGWRVDGDPWFDTSQRAFFTCPSVPGIEAALEHAYESRGDAELSARARRFVRDYDANLIAEKYWAPALSRIEQTLEHGRRRVAA